MINIPRIHEMKKVHALHPIIILTMLLLWSWIKEKKPQVNVEAQAESRSTGNDSIAGNASIDGNVINNSIIDLQAI